MDIERLNLRSLRRDELDTALDWAAAEGWNPGLHDAELFWQTDPDGFVAAEVDGELVGTGSIVSYGGLYGFMGLFIVKPAWRGRGIGTSLWFHRRDRLRSRLDNDAAIGMDGVFNMQDWYAQGGFVFSHRNLRMEGVGRAVGMPDDVIPIDQIPVEQVAAYDATCFGCPRPMFLNNWIRQPDSHCLALIRDETMLGYGVIRRCQQGYKIGPLFADNADVADELFSALAGFAPTEPIWLDIPENHADAVALAKRHEMREVFGCARMYHGSPPPAQWKRIYGITTFELG